MINRILFLILVFVCVQRTSAQDSHKWQLAGLDTTIHDIVGVIDFLPDSNIIVAGTAYHTPGDSINSDPFLIRMDKKGNIIWSKSFPGSVAENITSMVLTPQNTILLSGTTHSFNNRVIFNEFNEYLGAFWLEFNLNGHLLQARAFQEDKVNTTAKKVVSNNNNTYLLGTVFKDDKESYYVFEDAGEYKSYSLQTSGDLTFLNAVINNDQLVTTHSSNAFTGTNQGVIVASSYHNIDWPVSLSLNTETTITDIISTSGGYLACATNKSNGINKVLAIKISKTGTVQWAKSFGIPGVNLEAFDVIEAKSNEFHINGVEKGAANKGNTIVIDGSGNLINYRVYNDENSSVVNTTKSVDSGIFYVLKNEDNQNKNGWLIKNNIDNLYSCQKDKTNSLVENDVLNSMGITNVKNDIDLVATSLEDYHYGFHTPTVYYKNMFRHQTCFSCDIDASFTYTVDDSCYIVTFTPNDTTLNEFYWDFGEVESFSEDQFPVYEYDELGNYEVKLMGFNKCGMANITQTVEILPKYIAMFDLSIDCYDVKMAPEKFDPDLDYIWSIDNYYFNEDSLTYVIASDAPTGVSLVARNHCIAEKTHQQLVITDYDVSATFNIIENCQNVDFNVVDATNIDNIFWDLGDGTQATGLIVNHTYAEGEYEIQLIVSNDCVSDTSYQTIQVDDYTINPAFTYTVDCNVVTFSQDLTNVFSIDWSFDAAAGANPTHDFGLTGGNPNVVLTVTDECGVAYNSNQNINLPDYSIDPNFTDVLVCNEFEFQATEAAANLSGVCWDFGDNKSGVGHTINHVYDADGNYDVVMIAYNECNQETVQRQVVYNAPNNMVSFNFNDNCGDVDFTNTSTLGGINFSWDFGDGVGVSTQENPTYTFTPGTYTVSLTIDYGCETLTTEQTITINDWAVNASFNTYVNCKSVEVDIINTANITGITWDMGDGTTYNNVPSRIHTYADFNNYTIKLTASSICNADVEIQQNVVIQNQVVANAGPDVTICQGSSIRLKASGGDTYNWNDNGFIAPTNTDEPNVFPPTTSVFVVNVSDSECQGSDVDQVTVNVVAPPTATISGKETICDGETAMLPIAFTGQGPFTLAYRIDNGPIQSYGPTNNVNDFLPIKDAGDVFILNVSDQNCQVAVGGSGKVNVNNLPTANIGNATINVCNNDFAGLTVPINFTENGSWEFEVSINGAPQGVITTDDNPYAYPITQAGTYTINSIKNADCTGSGMGEIKVINNPSPTANINLQTSFCTGQDVKGVIDLIGVPPFNFEIYVDATLLEVVNNHFASTYKFDVLNGGQYFIRALNDKNCTATNDFGPFIIDEYTPPTATIKGSKSICNGQPVEIEFDFTGDGPFTFEYAIDGVSEAVLNTTNNSHSIFSNKVGEYTLISVSNPGCNGTISGTGQVYPTPKATISGNELICTGQNAKITFTFEGNPPFLVDLYKDGVKYDIINKWSNEFTYLTSEGGIYTINQFSDEDCEGTFSGQADIEYHETPTAVINGGGQICPNEETTIDFIFAGEGPYTFYYTEDFTNTKKVTDYTSNIYSFNTSKDKTFRLVYIENEYCIKRYYSELRTDVWHHYLPNATLIEADTICEGEPHYFKVDLEGTDYKYLTYSYNDIEIFVDSIHPDSNSYYIPAHQRGDYKLLSLDDSNCKAEQVFELGRLTVNDLPTLTFTGDTIICDYETAPLHFDFTGVAPYWVNLYRFANFEGMINPIYEDSVSIHMQEPGRYSVFTYGDAFCMDTLDREVTIDHFNAPVVRFEGGGIICNPEDSAVFENKTIRVDTSTIYTWNFDDGNFSNDTLEEVKHLFAIDRCYDVSLTHTTEDGCTYADTLFKAVCMDHLPKSNFSYEPENPTIFTDYILLNNETENGAEFTWFLNDGDDGINFDFNTVYHNFNRLEGNITNVCLVATSYLGCQDTICKEIEIKDEFAHYIPSAFSPNGDGINDYFSPVLHFTDDRLFELEIYDRLGEIVFTAKSVTIPIWDGRINGELAKQDVYTWRLRIKSGGSNKSDVEFGMVTVIY